MASKPEKSQRRAIARFQDLIESMNDADLRACLDSMSMPSAPKLWSALSHVLRSQIAANREARRIGSPEPEPDEDFTDEDE